MKYKVGDRVKIKDRDEFIKCGQINSNGLMNHHAGTVMTINQVNDEGSWYRMEEDINEACGGWIWTDEMIEGLVHILDIDNDEILSLLEKE